MDTKGKRGSNWTIDEEMLLIEQSKLKDEELFGKMKGCGDVKASTIRQVPGHRRHFKCVSNVNCVVKSTGTCF